MKRIITILLSVLFTVSIISCVENSGKYKDLKTRLDSLQREYGIRSDELDEVFAVLNEVEQGLQSIRESENIITVQARSRDGSFGLGLPIARQIVSAHRGRIWAESREGRARFYVELPLHGQK